MKVYLLDNQENLRSITLFHAMARLGYTGLIITQPAQTFVSLGMLDNLSQIVDYEACRELNIPIIRRETGGGTVLLSQGQVFYQLVLPKGVVPFKVTDAYSLLSQPVIRVYRRLGLTAQFRPINDILVDGKKISGQGSGDIGRCFVFVGNILIEFDTELMAKVFKLPSPHLRHAVKEALDENITWLKRYIKDPITFEEIAHLLVEEFSKDLPLDGISQVPSDALELADQLKEELTSYECLFEDTGKRHNLIKIREGVFLKNIVINDKVGALFIDNGVIKKVWGPFEDVVGFEYQRESLLRSFSPEFVDLLLK